MELLLPPPEKWQDFETLLTLVFKGSDIYGRPGQEQDGIDLYNAQARCQNERYVIQAKHKDFDKVITKGMVKEYAAKAESYFKKLPFSRLYIATTMKKDKNLQLEVSKLSQIAYQEKKYTIQILFWQNIQAKLNQTPEAVKVLYAKYVDKSTGCNLYNYLVSTLYFPSEQRFYFNKHSLEDIKLIERQVVYLCSNCNPALGVSTNGDSQELLTNFLNVFKELFTPCGRERIWQYRRVEDCWFAGRRLGLSNRAAVFQRLPDSAVWGIQNADEQFRILINTLMDIVCYIRNGTAEDVPGTLYFARGKDLSELDEMLWKLKGYYLEFRELVEREKESLELFSFMVKES